jgi:hypothetical protein
LRQHKRERHRYVLTQITERGTVEADLEDDVREIDARWTPRISNTSTLKVGLERTDVKVTHLVLAWVPVA